MLRQKATRKLVWTPTSGFVLSASMSIAENLKLLREKARLSQTGLARIANVSQQLVSQIENGTNSSTKNLPALAKALGVKVSEIDPSFADEGTPQESVIPVMGYIGAGGEVSPEFEQVPPDGLDQIVLPFLVPGDLIALEVQGVSMLPIYKPGTVIVVWREQRRPIETFYGEDAAVRTGDGRRFLKTISRGSNRKLVTLNSTNALPIEDVHLEWIGEIFTIMPPTAIRRAFKQGGIQGSLRLAANQ